MKISTFLKLWSIYAVVYFLYHYQGLIGMGMQDNVEWAITGGIFSGLYMWKLTEYIWNRLLCSIAMIIFLKLMGVTLLFQFKVVTVLSIVVLILAAIAFIINSLGSAIAREATMEDSYPSRW